jgi:entericidin B
MFKRLLALCCLGVVLAGCNTVAGVGRDVERGGEMMQNQARETQRQM